MFRIAEATDSKIFYDWRNDEVSRKNSISSDIFSWQDHVKWFESSLLSPTRQLFVYEFGGEPIGTMRVDASAEGYLELSWQLSPIKRGQGLGKKMLAEFVQEFQMRPLCAKIKASNLASVKMTEAAGFRLMSCNNEIQVWVLVK